LPILPRQSSMALCFSQGLMLSPSPLILPFVSADSPGDAYVTARETALAEGLILYRVIVVGGPYGGS
jgi:hypothetical protein